MIDRRKYLDRLAVAVKRSPVTALLGPRQCGKTTLAREFASERAAVFFDLESQADLRRLQNPELALASETGLIVLDEIQVRPELFSVLRVLVDRPARRARFLVLGSASPEVVRGASETLAGRVEFVELSGFDLSETGPGSWEKLWLRGGFPRSLLARSNGDSYEWREGFIRTFIERDLPQLGVAISSVSMRRFWTMLAHYHGQVWNASELARSMGLSDKTVRGYLDLLTGTFMVRQLQPWHENLAKRQVKSPKVYLRDTGLLHRFLELPDRRALTAHPRVGASFEGFALEQLLHVLGPRGTFFWSAHGGAELDLLLVRGTHRYGFEVKLNEAPAPTRSVHTAIEDLRLEHVWIVYPGGHVIQMDEKITGWPVRDVAALADQVGRPAGRRARSVSKGVD